MKKLGKKNKVIIASLIVILGIVGAVAWLALSKEDATAPAKELKNQPTEVVEDLRSIIDGSVSYIDTGAYKEITDHPYGKTINCGVLPTQEDPKCVDQAIMTRVNDADTFNELKEYYHVAVFEQQDLTLSAWLDLFANEGYEETTTEKSLTIDGNPAIQRTIPYSENDIRYYTLIKSDKNFILTQYYSTGTQDGEDAFNSFVNSLRI